MDPNEYDLLGSLLIVMGAITRKKLNECLNECPPGERIGDYLISQGVVSDKDVEIAVEYQNRIRQGPHERVKALLDILDENVTRFSNTMYDAQTLFPSVDTKH
jgi:hypothetical protein